MEGWLAINTAVSLTHVVGELYVATTKNTKGTVENLSILNDTVGETYEVNRPA